MKREAFLGAAAVALAAPTVALARKPGDGYKSIPYVPKMAEPYYDPIRELKREHVDPKIWPAVKLINKSGWVWTAESCQGHKNGWSDDPMIRLVCRSKDVPRMLGILALSAPKGTYANERNLVGSSIIQMNLMPAPHGWTEIRVHDVAKLGIFNDFAKLVNK